MKRPSLLSPLLMLVPAMLGARTVTSPRLDPAAIHSAADSALAAIATVVHHARQTIVSVDGVPRLFEERVAAARLVGDSIGFGVRIDIGDGISYARNGAVGACLCPEKKRLIEFDTLGGFRRYLENDFIGPPREPRNNSGMKMRDPGRIVPRYMWTVRSHPGIPAEELSTCMGLALPRRHILRWQR